MDMLDTYWMIIPDNIHKGEECDTSMKDRQEQSTDGTNTIIDGRPSLAMTDM